MKINSVNPIWLPLARFKRTMEISDEDWDASLPRIAPELRKGRRDMLRRVLAAAERLEQYSYDDTAATALPPPSPTQPASSPLGTAVDDFFAEHSRQWAKKTIGQNTAYLSLLVEIFGRDRLLGSITRQDANEVKKVLRSLPASRMNWPLFRPDT